MERQFEAVYQEWVPLIRQRAKAYAIPGRAEVLDLVQEGLVVLLETVRNGQLDPSSEEFGRYFKSAILHQFLDIQRWHTSKRRDHRKEYTDSELTLALTPDRQACPFDFGPGGLFSSLREGLPPVQAMIFDYLTTPGEETQLTRESIAEALSLTPATMKNELRKLKKTVSQALSGEAPPSQDPTPYLEALGFLSAGSGMLTDYPKLPGGRELTCQSLRRIMTRDEQRVMDYLLQWPKRAWELGMISRRIGMSIHQVRRCMDSSRRKIIRIYRGESLESMEPNETESVYSN